MTTEIVERRLVVARSYDAPRALVFAAWTEPDHMKHYWGPAGWSLPTCEVDPRPGGAFSYTMRSPEGDEHRVEGVISEIDPPRRLVILNELGGDGNHPPVRVTTIVTFEERDGRTLVSVDTTASADSGTIDAATEGMEPHWNEHLDRLGAYLPTMSGKD
jgi:uncharacterized protein YndB with AHSA1/START domain